MVEVLPHMNKGGGNCDVTSPRKVDLLLSAKVTSPQSRRLSKFERPSAGVSKTVKSDRHIVGRRLWYIPDESIDNDVTKEESFAKYPYMVHPASDFRRRWNFAALIIILYCSVDLPLDIAFYPAIEVNSGFVINCLFDAFFIVDICLNFRTGFEYHGRVVMEKR